jgi:hypothetical protein
MTTITATSPPSLEDRLADAEDELLVAQRALGHAVFDGVDEQAAKQRVAEIRARVEGLRLAQAEDVRRAEEAAAAEADRRAAVKRWKFLAWHLEYVERVAPVLELRAKLEAAEAYAMELGDLAGVIGDGGTSLQQWIEQEGEAGRLESPNLPQTTTVQMRVHAEHAYCNGSVSRVEARQLSTDDTATWAKKLALLVKQAASPLGKDAKPANLPWNAS